MKQILHSRISLVLILQFAVCINILPAQNWTGNFNADWNNSGNWSVWPLNNANIVIDPANYTGNSASPFISNASVFIPNKILLQNGAQVVIQNNLTTNDNFDVFGAGTLLTINSGTINIGLSNNGRLQADVNAAIVINNGSLTLGRSLAAGTGSTITMNNGTVNALQRLLLDLGGQFIFQNGNISVGQRLAISDGDAVQPSKFQMNGGNLTVSTEMSFVNESGNHHPSFNLAGGILTVNGNINWLGIAPGTGTPRFNIPGGTANINGNIINTVGSTNNMYINISDPGKMEFNGNLIENLYPTDSIIQNNNSNFSFNTASTFTNRGVFYALNSVTSFKANTSLQGTGIYNFDDLMIASSATLNHVSPLNLNVNGDFINNGIFISNLNTVNFNGTSAQSIDGSSITSFYKLNINNTSSQGVTVKKSILVTGQ